MATYYIMMKLCPCLEWAMRKFGKKEKKQAYEGPQEIEEEEFMNPNNREDAYQSEQPSLVETIEPPIKAPAKVIRDIPLFSEEEHQPESTNESDLLNFKMELRETPQHPSSTSREQEEPEADIEDLIKQELEQTPTEAMEAIKNNERSERSKSEASSVK